MTTWQEPKKRTRHVGEYKQKENMTKERWGEDMRDKYLTTWTRTDGETRRQIGYIMINAKYRNAAQKAPINIYWSADMNQNQQHRVQAMHLYYNAAKNIRRRRRKTLGEYSNMTYANYAYVRKNLLNGTKNRKTERNTEKNRREMRKNKQNKIKKLHPVNNTMEEWIKYKTKLGKALIQIYPLSKKKTDPAEPEWVTKLEQCGTEQEIQQLDNAYKKRTELQQEISRRSKKLIRKRDSSDFSRSYKHGGKQQDTPRNTLTKYNIPENQL